MARLWSSGFELNSTTAAMEWDTVTGTIQATTVRTGGFAGAVTSATSGTFKGFIYRYAAADANGPNWLRFYLNITANPNADTTIAGIQRNAGFENLTLKLTTTGTLKLFTQDGATQIGSASSALNTAQWYRIEMKMDNSPATGAKVGELQIDGSVIATSSTLTSTNMTGGANVINLGVNLEGEACTTVNINFDDVAMNDSTGSFQNSYPGAGQIVHLKPNAAGDNNSFTVAVGGTAGAANNFTRVNEIPPDDATSYNGAVLSGNIDDFNIDDTPGAIGSNDTINVVAVGVRYRAVVAAAEAAFKTRIKKTAAGTVSSSAAITPNATTWKTNANAVPTNYGLTLYQDPDSINWIKATLDTAQIGYTISTTNTNAANISNIWLLVDSTPAPPVAATYAIPVKIANKNVGPMALRYSFRQPITLQPYIVPLLSASVTQVAATVTASGGTQTVASIQIASVSQVAANVISTGGTQAVVAVATANASITQVAGSVTALGGTQTIATVQVVAISQSAGSVTATGGTQVVAGMQVATIAQIAATVTASGGAQTIATINNSAVSQIAGIVTASGGVQVVTATVVASASVTQVAATVTVAGGAQVLATINDSSVTQTAATVTASGGTQAVATIQNSSITQTVGTVTAAGGTQVVAFIDAKVNATVTQVAGTITASGGTQQINSQVDASIVQLGSSVTASGGTQSFVAVSYTALSQSGASITARGSTQIISTSTGPLPVTDLFLIWVNSRLALQLVDDQYIFL